MSDLPKVTRDILHSDMKLWERAQKTPHEKGTLLTLELPWGEPIMAVVEKLNDINAVASWGAMIRNSVNERKEEQEAEAVRSANLRKSNRDEPKPSAEEYGGPPLTVEEAVSTSEETIPGNESFGERIVRELHSVESRINELRREISRLEPEVRALRAAKEALDAQEDATETGGSSSGDAQSG